MATRGSKSKKSGKKATASKAKRVSLLLDLDELESIYKRQIGRGDGDTKGLLLRVRLDGGDTKGDLSQRLRADGDTKGNVLSRGRRVADGDTKGNVAASRKRRTAGGDTKGSQRRR